MDRLISEQVLIDTIKTWAVPLQISNFEAVQDIWVEEVCRLIKAIPSAEPKVGRCENCDTCSKNHCGDALCFGNNYCNWQPKQAESSAEPKWIPVSERLPDEEICERGKVWERKVLVTAYLSFDSDKNLFVKTQFASQVIKGGDENERYIAWMPLPTPYELQESEEV